MVRKIKGVSNDFVSAFYSYEDKAVMVTDTVTGRQFAFMNIGDPHEMYDAFEGSFSEMISVQDAIAFFSPQGRVTVLG